MALREISFDQGPNLIVGNHTIPDGTESPIKCTSARERILCTEGEFKNCDRRLPIFI